MMDAFKKVFQKQGDKAPARPDIDVGVAACALFLEMASIDGEFSDAERQRILGIVRTQFGLSEADATALAREAASELSGSIDLWQFTSLVNENYSTGEKFRVVELLWRVVYADGVVDAHEDYLMRKLAQLLRLQHQDLMAARLRAMKAVQDPRSEA